MLEQKEREKAKKDKEIKEEEELTKQISFIGLCTTKDEVHSGLDSMKT